METEVRAEKPELRLPHQNFHPPPSPPHTTSANMIVPFQPNPADGHFNPFLDPHYGRWCQFSLHPGFPLHAFFLFPLYSHYYYLPSHDVPYVLNAGEGYWPIRKMVDVGASVESGGAGGGSPVGSAVRLFQLRNSQSPGGGENISIAVEKERTENCDTDVIAEGPRSRNVKHMINGGKHKLREVGPALPPPRLRIKATYRRREAAGGWYNILRRGAAAQWRPKKSSHASADPPEDCGGGGGDSERLSGVKVGVYDDSSSKTSVMIKNIPNKLRRLGLITFLDGYCKEHQLEFDFLYLPMDFKTQDNKGYAFLNLTNAASAAKVKEHLNNFEWGLLPIKGCMRSKKICEVTWAKLQGKEALVQHFQNSNFRCHTDEYLPAVFNPPRNGSSKLSIPQPIGDRSGPPVLGRCFAGRRGHPAAPPPPRR